MLISLRQLWTNIYIYDTARSSYASMVLGIVILSVCPSVTRVLCDETKEHTADILIYRMKG